ncbi:MAG: cupin domain-containing protein [Chloroflexi bacterium]|nr:cupin domain-containing protein [Chloroflexota bacterium]
MRIVRVAEVPQEDVASPLFIGGVSRQTLVGAKLSSDFSMAIVNFDAGARNKFHRHSRDQVLLVTYGTGIVATDEGEVEVHQGDLIVIPAGEKHWHGATPASAFSHISLTAPGSTTDILE